MTRSEQSRINGARSCGPVTQEGRARSAINHTKHGMHSTRVVLETESKEIFQSLANLYHGIFLPQDQFEADLVDSLIHSRWKIRRLESTHTAELDLTIAQQKERNAALYGPNIGPDVNHALAYRTNGNYLDILDRHLDRQERLFSRCYRGLARYRKDRPMPSLDDLHGLEWEYPENTEFEKEAFQKEAVEPEPLRPEAAPAEPQPEPQPVSAPACTEQNQTFEPRPKPVQQAIDPFAHCPEQLRFLIDRYPHIRTDLLDAWEVETRAGRL